MFCHLQKKRALVACSNFLFCINFPGRDYFVFFNTWDWNTALFANAIFHFCTYCELLYIHNFEWKHSRFWAVRIPGHSKHCVNLWISPLGFVSRVTGLWRACVSVSGVGRFPIECREQGFPPGRLSYSYSGTLSSKTEKNSSKASCSTQPFRSRCGELFLS